MGEDEDQGSGDDSIRSVQFGSGGPHEGIRAERELWDGKRAGQEGAIRDFGADDAFPITFPSAWPTFVSGMSIT